MNYSKQCIVISYFILKNKENLGETVKVKDSGLSADGEQKTIIAFLA